MKKMFIPVLALLGMVACTNENEPEIEISNNEPVEIKMAAAIVDVNAKTRTIAKEGEEVVIAFAKQESKTDPTNWNDAENVNAKINTDKSITFDTPQYYSTDAATNTYFIGYSPAGTLSNGIVTFTGMNGSQDIIYAEVVQGNKNTGKVELKPAFTHKLAQLQFKFVKDASFQSAATVTEIKINGTKLPESLNIANGIITYATSTSTITAFTGATYAMGNQDPIIPANNLIEVGINSINLDITLSDNSKFMGIPVSLTTKEATAHVITLTFKQAAASGSASIGTWATEDAGNTDVQ